MKTCSAKQLTIVLVTIAGHCLFAGVAAADATQGESIIQRVGFDQHLGVQVPLDVAFRDESGREVHLGDYFGGPPVILVMAYYRCPMLCTEVLNGVREVAEALPFEINKQFRVVTVSIDPEEGPELAAAKKAAYTSDFGKPGAEAGWHFLTGSQASIERLASAVGFRYVYDPQLKQFAHASGIVVLTPNGNIARYFFGIQYPVGDVRLALVEASAGKVGSITDQLLLLCYHFDETTGKYTPAVMLFVRLAGALTLLVLGVFLGRTWLRDRRMKQDLAQSTKMKS